METLTELRQLRRGGRARYARVVIKRSHGGGDGGGSGGDGGEFALIAMNAEREINQILSVYDFVRARARMLRDEPGRDGNWSFVKKPFERRRDFHISIAAMDNALRRAG